MKKLQAMFLSLFLITNINTNLQAYLTEAKKEQIRKEFEDVTGTNISGTVFFITTLFTGFMLNSIENMIGLNNIDPYKLVPIAWGTSCGLQAGNSQLNYFKDKVKNNAFTKCNEYNLSADECYDTLKKSDAFQELFYNEDPKYKSPQEFKREYEQYLKQANSENTK